MSKRFSEKEEREIARQYKEDKLSTIVLAKRWGCSFTLIRNAIIRNGGKLRTLNESHLGQKVWNTGLTKETDERVRSTSEKLKGILKSEETKQKMRGPKSEKHKINLSKAMKGKIPWKMFTKEEEFKICNEYFSKEKPSVITLGKKYNCNSSTIGAILLRNGFSLRTHEEAHKTFSYLEKMSGKNNPMKRLEVRMKFRGEKNSFYNQHHSDITKQILREKAILQHQTQHGPFKNTKPELKMKEILNELNILFDHQFRIGNCLFDFRIINTNILIEVDGDYYHCNPEKFIKLNKMQLEMKERDKKHNEVAKTNNFTLLRFWESDILKNTEEVKEKICNIIFKSN